MGPDYKLSRAFGQRASGWTCLSLSLEKVENHPAGFLLKARLEFASVLTITPNWLSFSWSLLFIISDW